MSMPDNSQFGDLTLSDEGQIEPPPDDGLRRGKQLK